MGNNGGLEKNPDGGLPKSTEQLAKERAERFASNPETFIEIDEVVCCVVRSNKSDMGISVFIGNAKRSELDLAWAELNHRIQMVLRAMEAQPKIVPAKGGMLNFGRRRN